MEGQNVLHLCRLGELVQPFEAGVHRGQVLGFVEHAVVRVIRVAGNHLVHAAVVGVAQHHATLPGVGTLFGVDGFRVEAVVGVQFQVDRAELHAVNFGGGGVVAFVAGAGAAGTGDARRVGLVIHHLRAAGFHRRDGGHVKLHAADVEVLHPGTLAVVVHPEVVVDALLRTLVEVTPGPEIGVRVGLENIGHPGVGLFQVNLVAPVVDHHVDVPYGAVFALESFGELELAAVAFVAQTTNR